ncbi:MAG: hypothetical protein AB7O66_17845 [Limisphaerales bacterium]
MPRVILTLLLLCQPFCLTAADLGFADPGLLGDGNAPRSRVFVVHNPAATRNLSAQPEVVADMVSSGVTLLTGKTNASEAWRSLVSPDQVVGVKVHSSPGSDSGTRPAVASAVLRGLLDAGHPPQKIILWDRRLSDLRAAGFDRLASSLGVRLAGAADAGFDPEGPYENSVLGQLVFGDLEFSRSAPTGLTNEVAGRRSHFSRLITREITRHIIIAPLLNHNQAGVSGVLYSVASAVTDNFLRFEAHPSLLARAVPEIFGKTNIADQIALNVVDALIGQYEGSQRSLLHYSATPNEIRFSLDPVALDVLSIEELNRIRARVGVPQITNRTELYENAALLELGTSSIRTIEVIQAD